MAELLFLGTGAADWDISNRGDFFRRFSAALLDGKLMLDCGPHIFDFAQTQGSPDLFSGVETVLVTHCHDDHFDRGSILKLAEEQKLHVGGCEWVKKAIGTHENIEFTVFEPFSPVSFRGYTVMPILANHDVVLSGGRAAYHYIVTAPDGKTLFYGLDGAWFLRPSWNEMQKHKFDLMVLDCTVGDFDDWRLFEHNTIPMLRKMVSAINESRLLAPGGKTVASHLARTLHEDHRQTCAILSDLGTVTAYDGLKLQF